MHYRRLTSLAILVTICTVAKVVAQDDLAPRTLRRPLDVLSLDDDRPAASPSLGEANGKHSAGLPQIDHDGQVNDAGVVDRLRGMRRRAVDVNLSRSFVTSPVTQVAQHQGDLPAVARRPIGKAAEAAPTPSPAKVVKRPTPADESPRPTPATSNVPTPTAESVVIPTRPYAGTPTPAQPEPTSTPRTPRMATKLPSARVQPQPSVAPRERSPSESAESGILLTNRAPAITFETLGPRKIIIGQESAYNVRMINMGDVPAGNVLVTVRMPVWAEVSSSSASRGNPAVDSADESASIVTWQLPKLAAGGSETLSIGIVPRDSRPIELSVGWAFNPNQASAQIEVQEPMLQMDISGPADVNYGETAKYSITLANPGTGDARNVVLNLLPSTQQRVSGSRQIGTLAMGERKSIDVELTAHQAGRLQVRAMAHADGGLRDEANKEVIVRRARLELALLGPPRNFAASSASYKIRIENTGDAVAESSAVVATLPARSEFLRASDSGEFLPERGQVEWRLGDLQPGVSRVLDLQCELNVSGENRLDVHCDAARDISIAKSVITHVEALADLKLYVNDPKGAIAVGEDSDYEVRIENRGTKAAEMIQVIGYFSDGIEPVSVRGAKGDLAEGQVVLDPIASIEPGQSIVFHITARANRQGNHVFRTELQCSQPETRLASEEWTKYYNAAGNFDSHSEPQRQQATMESQGDTFQLESP